MEQGLGWKVEKSGYRWGNNQLEKVGIADELLLKVSEKEMEVWNLQHNQARRQGGWISEILFRWRCNFDDRTSKWAEMGGNNGVSSRKKRVFDWGQVEKIS